VIGGEFLHIFASFSPLSMTHSPINDKAVQRMTELLYLGRPDIC